MTPSAVSQQMAVLEREAGVALLERSGRGVRLTDAGRGLVGNTERVLAALEHAEADLAAASKGIVGSVRVSAFPTAARTVLVPALIELQRDHPNLRVSMIDLEPEESMPALKARELDVVVTYEWDLLPALEDSGVEREELFVEHVYLALPDSHPLAQRGGPIALAELARRVVDRGARLHLDARPGHRRGAPLGLRAAYRLPLHGLRGHPRGGWRRSRRRARSAVGARGRPHWSRSARPGRPGPEPLRVGGDQTRLGFAPGDSRGSRRAS